MVTVLCGKLVVALAAP
ncbi:hypothetical protein QU579_23590 (plasmid) [Vibrio parahaemolyticus]|uniref:Uncharacterized protein n=2 Tax=Unclassified Bacteria TaxID=49928 RepID=A0AAU6UWX4_UNCXX|nr:MULTISPECIES: hypothetical protein [Gammaproteobacteria]MCL8338046.1 hypothetical protein [Pseudomonas mosselii]MCR9379251.1 hypothetical protein [Vibrio cholerae]MCR9700227.1 hypothetical protein [Vibrio cholerae]MCU8247141.1 hypothetical protein [Vibrio vulnificus]MDT8797061.1 hypothetical protein [Vibrio cholerae]